MQKLDWMTPNEKAIFLEQYFVLLNENKLSINSQNVLTHWNFFDVLKHDYINRFVYFKEIKTKNEICVSSGKSIFDAMELEINEEEQKRAVYNKKEVANLLFEFAQIASKKEVSDKYLRFNTTADELYWVALYFFVNIASTKEYRFKLHTSGKTSIIGRHGRLIEIDYEPGKDFSSSMLRSQNILAAKTIQRAWRNRQKRVLFHLNQQEKKREPLRRRGSSFDKIKKGICCMRI